LFFLELTKNEAHLLIPFHHQRIIPPPGITDPITKQDAIAKAPINAFTFLISYFLVGLFVKNKD
jgi:hypothetical protein